MSSQTANEFPRQPQQFLLPGPVGNLDVMTTWPKSSQPKAVGIICHPNPLQEGTMHNKVVTTIAKAFNELGLATVRFNFRGVGESEGEFGKIIDERDDLMAVMDWVKHVLPDCDIWLAGFSFGSYIAASVANQEAEAVVQLVSIAPPIHHHNFAVLTHITCPWLIVQGDQDELIPFSEAKAFAEHPPVPIKWIVAEGVGHFFHDHLIELRDLLIGELRI